eukprot:SRR837773.23628.p3 GENE.SRR837773.23628~~SRR837773.23628.p3  ORF type:complete len:187 (-),score=57.10 SRR837773.23628:63-575(-)
MEARPGEVEEAVGAMLQQASAAPSAEMAGFTEEQATNQVVFTMVLGCYQNIDPASVDEVRGGGRLPAAVEDDVFKPAAAPLRPSRRQYRLLEKVMQEHRMKEMRVASPEELYGMSVPGTGMSARAKALYVLLVVAILAAAVAWTGRWLLQAMEPREKERSSKSLRQRPEG